MKEGVGTWLHDTCGVQAVKTLGARCGGERKFPQNWKGREGCGDSEKSRDLNRE